jgi:pilus assembly protein CpaE
MARLYSSDVILADLDLPFGSASLGFNIERAQGSLAQAIADQRLDDGLLERLLTKSGEHLNILTAPASLDGCYDLGEKVFEQVLDIARSTVPFVALDVPHIWTSWAKKTLLDADEVVITATPDLVSLRNARNLIEALRQSRPNDAPPRLVLNQVGMPKRSEVKASQFAAALHIEPIACLAFDPSTFSTAANSGRMIADVSARSAASKAFTNIAQTISARTGLTRNRRGRFALGRLWRK